MSPPTVSPQRRITHPNPLDLNKILIGNPMLFGLMGLSGIVAKMLARRELALASAPPPNLTQAPLSAEQASQERIWQSLRHACSAESHTVMRDDDETWATLEHVKDWIFGDEVLEQRNCPHCGSTLARRKQKQMPADIFIDPQGKKGGNDRNDGLTAKTPLKTMHEADRRWGGYAHLRGKSP
jgi:hypothetical protein